MKKILTVVLALSLLFSVFALVANAEKDETNYSTKKWYTWNGTEINPVEGVSSAAVAQAWVSPKIEVLEDLRTALGTKDEVTVKFSCDVRVTALAAGKDFGVIRAIVRASMKVNPDVATAYTNYKSACTTASVKPLFTKDASNNVFWVVNEDQTVEKSLNVTTNWATYESDAWTFSKTNLSTEYFNSLNFCFDRIADCAGNFEIKNFAIKIVDKNEATPTPSATAEVSAEPEKVPTGVKFTFTGEVPDSAASWMISTKGMLSAADVKDDQIVKTFLIKNTSETDINLNLCFQTVYTSGGTTTWKGPGDGPYITIAAGDTEEFELIMDVEEGKVAVGDQEIDLGEFFYRLNVKGEDGTNDFADISFIIACSGADYEKLVGIKTINGAVKPQWSIAPDYTEITKNNSGDNKGTGDVLPVALLAILTVATASVIVVAKKKKEN